jgi:ankyrin repeat protein
MYKLGLATAVAVSLVMMAISGSAASGDQDKALMEAASQNDLLQARDLLIKGANVNARSEQGWTALMQAAASGRLEIVKLLLDKGADVNAKDYEGTALIKASSCGHFDVVSLLLKRGADVNATDREGKTASMVVCKEGDKRAERAIVDLFKAHGATAASDGSEQASPEGAIDPNLMATWELLYQTDEQGKNEQNQYDPSALLSSSPTKGWRSLRGPMKAHPTGPM